MGYESSKDKTEREKKEKIEAEQKALKEKQYEETRRVKETFGDEIPCTINTVGYTDKVDKKINSSVKNSWRFINRKKGLITFIFDYKLQEYDQGLRNYLIRLFDENGQYLNHFVTSEYYSILGDRDSREIENDAGGRIKVIPLLEKQNVLYYPVNMRDAAYVAATEFRIAFDVR